MKDYRVVKVVFDNGEEKYAAQKSKPSDMITFKWLIIPFSKKDWVWNTLHEVSNGTDNLVPVFYDTKEEAWTRVEKDKRDGKLAWSNYKIINEYYDK